MNDIGFGILCFGDFSYYEGAWEKCLKIREYGFDCYILTDNTEYFLAPHGKEYILRYDREVKSYHDKMLLPKHILRFHDICILIDADTHITDYSFLHALKTYEFKKGISYVDVLYNHPEKKRFICDLDLTLPEWSDYENYIRHLYHNFTALELIWEYFLVINPEESDVFEFFQKFYEVYDKLQVVKEYCDIKLEKKVVGNGEGISISVAAELSGITCERDITLYDIIKDKMVNVSRKFTPKEKWPEWMK